MAHGLRPSMKRLMALMLPVALVVGSTSAQIFAALNLDSSPLNPPLNGPAKPLTTPFRGCNATNAAAVHAPVYGVPQASRFFAQAAAGVTTVLTRAPGATNAELASTYNDAATGGWACLTGFWQLTGSAAARPLKPVNCAVNITAVTVQGARIQRTWIYTAPTAGAWPWKQESTADMAAYLSSLSSVAIDLLDTV